jgi:hypothetical protein
MSHVATVQIEVKDLDVLRRACKRIGLEFVADQKQYRWWGTPQSDQGELPAGFAAGDLGHCDHAIRIPQGHAAWASKLDVPEYSKPYEIGVCRRRDGKPGFVLMIDPFCGGMGLLGIAGDGCVNLKRAYAIEAARKQATAQGYRVQEQQQAGGGVRLVLSK